MAAVVGTINPRSGPLSAALSVGFFGCRPVGGGG